MVENIQNNLKMLVAALLIILFSAVSDISASYQEIELFDEGYEYYLSYQPEKAVEVFRRFLKEFPDSSTKDAAMFWLGKSLMQLKSFDEARKTFSEVRQQFPESPFVTQVDQEIRNIDSITKTEPVGKSANGEKTHRFFDERLADTEKKAKHAENALSEARIDRENLILQLEEERKKQEEIKEKIAALLKEKTELKADRSDTKTVVKTKAPDKEVFQKTEEFTSAPVPALPPKQIIPQEGLIVKDNIDLTWTKKGNLAGIPMNWDDAVDFIRQLNEHRYAGYSDWRLPTADELKTLARHIRIYNFGFGDIQKYYLSSTVSPANISDMAGVDMKDGHISYIGKSSTTHYIWPVRNSR
ncbi:MAG: DUF1566 domain-containing protein [Nitrospirae bacterium]|nr:DUF1566 domain-containing protein [Nitrospirota bacterium]